jgi:hypothetical protein
LIMQFQDSSAAPAQSARGKVMVNDSQPWKGTSSN